MKSKTRVIYIRKDKDIDCYNLIKIQKCDNGLKVNDFSVRFSLNNLSLDGKIVNIPLYFIEYIDNLEI